jgi:Tol biopolymer transport system component
MHRDIALVPQQPHRGPLSAQLLTAFALLTALLALAVALPANAGAAVLPVDATAIVSGTPDLLTPLLSPAADSFSQGHAISRDGRRVVFESASDGLVTDDDDDVVNVYVKDVATGAVQLVSRADGVGAPSHGDCSGAAISADGRAVAFTCEGALDPADANGLRDVYVRNLDTQRTVLVSRASGGGAGNRASEAAVVAHDGTGRTFVAFDSRASDLVAGLPAGDDTERIYRREVGGADAMTLVSNAANSTEGASAPSISDDGSTIAFDTRASLVAADLNGSKDVYVRVVGGAVTLVSRANGVAGAVGAGSSSDGLISGDGTTVAFSSPNSYDAVHDSGTDLDAYRRDLVSGTTTLQSIGANGVKANAGAEATSIDTAGDAVAFSTNATNLDPADTRPGDDAYVNRGAGAVLLSRPDGTTGPAFDKARQVALDGDGTKATMTLSDSFAADVGTSVVVLRDLLAHTTRTLSRPPGDAPFAPAGGFSTAGSVSPDGRYVAFSSTAPALGVLAGTIQSVFVRDVASGQLTLASRLDGPTGALFGGVAANPRISADGRRVAFSVDREDGSPTHVYVRDIAQGRTLLVDQADGGGATAGNGSSSGFTISDDGSRVAFISQATNLSGDDADSDTDVYVRDLGSGRTLLVSRANGLNGAHANGVSIAAAISGDGRSVAFDSLATNLVTGDANAREDVFLRDVDPGTTRLVSITGAATQGDGDSFAPSIDRTGNRIGFLSTATNFNSPLAGMQLYVRDRAAGTLAIAGRADGPGGAPLSDTVIDSRLSADGNHVVFSAIPSGSIAPGAPADGAERVYERDLASGATRLISRRSGPAGEPSTAAAEVGIGGITADGGCVAFSARGRFAPPPAGADFSEVYLRAVTPNCGRPIPPGPPSPPPVLSTPAAVLSRLAMQPARFHVGGRRGGTRIVFRLDKDSAVTLRFDRLLAGHKRGRRCLAKASKGRRCTVVRPAGRVSLVQRRLHAGANTIGFSGRIGKRALKPGRYRLTATPSRGKARTVRFVVVKAPKPKPKRGARRS